MVTVPCPRCGHLVGLDEKLCPHCQDSRSEVEIEEGWAFARNEGLRLRWRSRLTTAGVAGLAILGLTWFMRASLTAAWDDFAAEVERTRDPRPLMAAAAPAGLPAAPTAPSAQVAVSSFVYLAGGPSALPEEFTHPATTPGAFAAAPAAPAATSTASASAAPAPIPPPPDSLFRRYYGVVYDLDTLKPLAGARLEFKAKGDDTGWTATVNDLGHYQMDLFKGPDNAMTVSAAVPGYRPGLLEEKDPPLRERSRSARRMIIDETSDSDLEPIPLRFRQDDELVELDLVVVPQAAK